MAKDTHREKMNDLSRTKRFPVLRQKSNPNFAVKDGERSNHSISVYLMKEFVQTSALFNIM